MEKMNSCRIQQEKVRFIINSILIVPGVFLQEPASALKGVRYKAKSVSDLSYELLFDDLRADSKRC